MAVCVHAAEPAGQMAKLARALRETELDAGQCYRVRELNFAKEDVRFYLTEGLLIFGKPVDGRIISAVFTADVEGGDAELILMPPRRGERMSLASFTGSPNLNEHFKYSVMIFTDSTGNMLLESLRKAEAPQSPERGLLLAGEWNPVLRNLAASFEVRLVQDILTDSRVNPGFFYTALGGGRLNNFDIMYDPRAREHITVGQVAFREDRRFFDIWTSFPGRAARTAPVKQPAGPQVKVDNVRLDATLEPDLLLRVTTRLTLTPTTALDGPIAFDVSRQMRIIDVTIDGEPAELFQRESLRANLIRGRDSDPFLVMPAKRLEAGKSYAVEIRHEGAVVGKAAEGIYYVSARGNWYPYHGMQYANYELTFRYPRGLNLVATGDIVEDRSEGEWQITRRKTNAPVRIAAFNLGDYHLSTVKRGGLTVEVYANRKLEPALQPRPEVILAPAPLPPFPRRQRSPAELTPVPIAPAAIDPAARLEQFASDIAGGLEFMAAHFGPPPLATLKVSPVPGTFGQGFPGMVYISTLSYLSPKDRPIAARGGAEVTFFSELLHAHETAHQWWGNAVASAGYQDDWLMEALANYSALLYLEKRKGARAMDEVLESYQRRLLQKDTDGHTVESAGPIVWGMRLQSSQSPNAWRTIVYEKGAWIMHMLRRRMGDAAFLKMLGEVVRRHRNRSITTDEFRSIAAEFLPPRYDDPKLEYFFDAWVYGTGIPKLQLSQSVSGKAPSWKVSGTIRQSGVSDDFSADVPVVVQLPGGRSLTHWIRTGSEPAPFTIPLKVRPARVSLDPTEAVLAER